MSSAGDVNGDGFDDLLIGAGLADAAANGKSDAGESYIIFGSDFTLAVTHPGTAESETLTGNAADNVMIGGRGNDLLIGNGGADVLRGGEGNDTLAISDLTFKRVVGGNGFNVLRLDGGGLALNLKTLADNRLLGIEQIDLTGSGNNTLTLDLAEVLNLSDESNTLLVRRNTGDTVDRGGGWTQEANEVSGLDTFEVFTQGQARLKVQLVAEPPPAVILSVSAAIGTEAGLTQITVTATAASAVSGDQTVTLDVSGTGITTDDYALSQATITILSGQTIGSVTFTVKDDLLNEGNETATLALSSPSAGIVLGTPTTQNITITDDDSPPTELVVLTLGGGDVTWIKKRPPITVLPLITVTGSASLAGGTLSLSVNVIGTAKKLLDNFQLPSFSGIGSSGGPQVTNGQLTLQIQLNGSATKAAIQNFLRGITFATTGKGLKAPTRTIGVTLTADGSSSSISQTIRVLKKG